MIHGPGKGPPIRSSYTYKIKDIDMMGIITEYEGQPVLSLSFEPGYYYSSSTPITKYSPNITKRIKNKIEYHCNLCDYNEIKEITENYFSFQCPQCGSDLIYKFL